MKFGKKNSFNCVKEIDIQSNKYNYFSLAVAEKQSLSGISKLPNSLKVLLENLLRFEDGITVDHNQIQSLKDWLNFNKAKSEIAFRSVRVLLQDYTVIPAVADLAAMREAVQKKKKDPKKCVGLSI